ncbi:Lipid A 3-O-deacylase (PagL) [Polaribacter sp. KT25b]|uniref:acyloxyacyl hydrolase n=1 Tax=Polaribacter sp. KT25b TaxID=1855336 RepID=UPI00087B6478|nr:acyloxyacyl hydrolase [Polaribacter sp. KT25b]SDR89011.1 Lipid A 3-O-deacylase (PagL) [Polaribacter sp. KT25b]
MRKSHTILIILFVFTTTYSQEKKKSTLKPSKIGFLYNYGTNENLIFDDVDYTYSTNTFKAQAFYKLGNWKNLNFELIVQPQVQFLDHQLINEQFVLPSEENYLEKRAEFTKAKTMNLYGIEFGIAVKKQLTEKLNFQGTISLGFNYIDTRTERIAKGFTFIENFSVGFSHQTFTNSFIYLGTNFGHVSNLNFQQPNNGYNILGLEIGYSYALN